MRAEEIITVLSALTAAQLNQMHLIRDKYSRPIYTSAVYHQQSHDTIRITIQRIRYGTALNFTSEKFSKTAVY